MGKSVQSWWIALSHYPSESLVLLFGGGLFVLIFQVNITWLAGLTSATTVGIVGGVKVVPQWMFNAIFNLKLDLSTCNITGAALAMVASVIYAVASSYPERTVLEMKLVWKSRDTEEPSKAEPL